METYKQVQTHKYIHTHVHKYITHMYTNTYRAVSCCLQSNTGYVIFQRSERPKNSKSRQPCLNSTPGICTVVQKLVAKDQAAAWYLLSRGPHGEVLINIVFKTLADTHKYT